MAHQNNQPTTGMLNDEGKCVDLYIPRKCDYTNKLLSSKDKSSVQLNIANVDENGKATKEFQTIVISGYLRAKGLSAGALEVVLKKRGIIPISPVQA